MNISQGTTRANQGHQARRGHLTLDNTPTTVTTTTITTTIIVTRVTWPSATAVATSTVTTVTMVTRGNMITVGMKEDKVVTKTTTTTTGRVIRGNRTSLSINGGVTTTIHSIDREAADFNIGLLTAVL